MFFGVSRRWPCCLGLRAIGSIDVSSLLWRFWTRRSGPLGPIQKQQKSREKNRQNTPQKNGELVQDYTLKTLEFSQFFSFTKFLELRFSRNPVTFSQKKVTTTFGTITYPPFHLGTFESMSLPVWGGICGLVPCVKVIPLSALAVNYHGQKVPLPSERYSLSTQWVKPPRKLWQDSKPRF